MRGLVHAIIDAAAFAEARVNVSVDTFIALAEFYGKGKLDLALPCINARPSGCHRRRPGMARTATLMAVDSESGTVRFHHDELVEGIVRCGNASSSHPRCLGVALAMTRGENRY